jgi:hypothetical protein
LDERERRYDEINNEGGDGFNPYRAKRERQEHEAEVAWSKTPAGRKDAIYRMLERLDCSIARECGTYDKAQIDQLHAELAQIEAGEQAAFAAAWPLELTKERRAAWNARVRNGEFGTPPTFRRVAMAEHNQGWTGNDLKRAVKLHNL